MKKLLALASTVGAGLFPAIASGTALPSVVLISLVLFLNSLLGPITFDTGTATLAGAIVLFVRDFFTQGGITPEELIIGL